MKTFEEFKDEILQAAKKANACSYQYKRAYAATGWAELFNVIKDNFLWCFRSGVITGEIIDSVKEEAAKCELWHNESVERGLLLATGSATVRALGSARVLATDSSRIEVFGSARVLAIDSARVEASDSARVKASDSATVLATDLSTITATDSATVKALGSARVLAYGSARILATGSSTVLASGSATVEASGSAYINIMSNMECRISDYAIMRFRDTNEVITTSSMKHKTI